jgi:hypothetical protein
MADLIVSVTIKDVSTNLVDYDRMAQSLEPVPETDGVPDYTNEQWRTEWLPRFIRRQMGRFEGFSKREAIMPRVVLDTDVTKEAR